jgi:glycosyltransferase involved in cell wall biosynthesis
LGWIRGNYFIPDARVTWVKPSVEYLSDYLLYNPVDAVITTGPPHSMHLIGLELKRQMGVRWIADFRDQWLKMDNKRHFSLSRRSYAKHAALEKTVIQEADEVISVSYTAAAEYAAMRGKPVHTITNGYDEEDFAQRYEQRRDYFIVGHYGTLGADRDHPEFWERLQAEAAKSSRPLVLELVGPTDAGIVEKAREVLGAHRVWYREYLPHAEVIKLMMQASVLVLLINRNESAPSRITGKVFEYMACEREIWVFGGVDGGWLIKLIKNGNSLLHLERKWISKKMLLSIYG